MTIEKNDVPSTQTQTQREKEKMGNATIAGFKPYQAFAASVVERVDGLYVGAIQAETGIETGFRQLDELSGGFHPGELIVVAGRPKSGRTAFAAQVANHVSRSQSPCAYYTSRLTGDELASRMLCMPFKLEHRRLTNGKLTDDDWPKLTTAFQLAIDSTLYINESRQLNAEQMCESARELARAGDPLRAIFIDSFPQLSQHAPEENGEQVWGWLAALKKLGMELDCPVIVVASVKIDPDLRTDKRPLIGDIWYGREIDAIADTILILHRDRWGTAARNEIELRVVRQQSGSEGTITLGFDVLSMTLFEMETPDLPILVGSDKQIIWAHAIRERYRANDPLSPHLQEQISASWWINNHESI